MNLNQVTIPSTNVEKAVIFYQSLGLHLIVYSMPHYARFECQEGDSTFSIHLVENIQNTNGVSVYFECINLDEKVEELIDLGIKFDELPTDKPYLWREARLKDLDGNQIVLYYAGDNRKNPPWRID